MTEPNDSRVFDGKAPVLRPEHIVSRRTLARKSKDDLIDYALMLMEDVQNEADNSAHWMRATNENRDAIAKARLGAGAVIRALEARVRSLQEQVEALSKHALDLKGHPQGPRIEVAPGAGIFHDERLITLRTP